MVRSRSVPPPRLVFSVGVPFSGSTAFGNFVNALSPNAYLGELDRLPQNRAFYAGPDHAAGCYRCRAADVVCPFWGDDAVAELSTLSTVNLYTRLLDRTRHRVVVDGSKTPSYFQRIVHDFPAEWDVRIVVLTRNPVHSMASYLGRRGAEHSEVPAWQAANFWRDTYAHITAVVGSYGLPAVYFATEALRVTDPAELEYRTRGVRRLLGLDGIPVPRTMPEVEAMFHASHQYGGNEMVQTVAGDRSHIGKRAAAIRTKRWSELVDAFLQAPGAVEVAKAAGINVREAIEGST